MTVTKDEVFKVFKGFKKKTFVRIISEIEQNRYDKKYGAGPNHGDFCELTTEEITQVKTILEFDEDFRSEKITFYTLNVNKKGHKMN